MSEEAIRFIGDLQRTEIRAGDKFILRLSREPQCGEVKRIQQSWHEFCGHVAPLLIIGPRETFELVSFDGEK